MKSLARTLSRNQTFERLKDWVPDGTAAAEMAGYIRQSTGRLLASAEQLEQLPRGARVLEIGSIPYYLPLLMRELRPDLQWVATNWEGQVASTLNQGRSRHQRTGEIVQFDYYHYNVETEDPAPFERESFDAVVFCEVLEHLFRDPGRAIENLHGALRPGGHLLLTTPNPARAYNLQRLVLRQSFYDPISGYGPYGRHNREYGAAELATLLSAVGFEVRLAKTVESSNDHAYRRLLARLGYGEHHIVWAERRPGPAKRYRPRWLYRSYDESFYSEAPE